MTKILVTGAAGRLGPAMLAELEGRADVTAFDRVQGATQANWQVGDLLDRDAVRRAVEGQDSIIHLGALAHILAGTADDIIRTNTIGTWNILSAAEELGVKRIAVCSTDSVIGFTVREGAMMPPDYLPVREDHPVRATDPYGLSKVLVEAMAHSFALRGKLEVVVLRPVYVHYPEMDVEIRNRALDPANYSGPGIPGKAAAGGGVVWHHVDPRDVATGFRLAIEKPGLKYDTFFLTAACTLGHKPTLERMREYLGGALPEVVKPEVYESNPYAPLYDMSHAREVLGYEPKYHSRAVVADIYAANTQAASV